MVAPWVLECDWAMWANTLFFFGSVMWFWDPPLWFIWELENVSGSFALAASLIFVIDGGLYMVDWYLAKQERKLDDISSPRKTLWRRVDWYLLAMITFWAGTFGDLGTSIIEAYFVEQEVAAFCTDIFASHLWTVSGAFELVWLAADRLTERERQTKPRLSLIGQLSKRDDEKAEDVLFDWQAWGDIFFFPGGLGYSVGAYGCWFGSDAVCFWTQMVGAFGFLMQAVLYYPYLIRDTDRYATLRNAQNMIQVAETKPLLEDDDTGEES